MPAASGCNGLCAQHFRLLTQMSAVATGGMNDLADTELPDADVAPDAAPDAAPGAVSNAEPHDQAQASGYNMPSVSQVAPSITTTTLSSMHVDALMMQMAQLSNQVQMLMATSGKQKGGPRAHSDRKLQRVAKRLYYHNRKTDPSKEEYFKPRLESAGLWVPEKPTIPWQFVKQYTDKEFDSLDALAQGVWLQKARVLLDMTM